MAAKAAVVAGAAALGFNYLNSKMNITEDMQMLKKLGGGGALLGKAAKWTSIDAFKNAAESWPDKEAYYFIDEDRSLTFAQVWENSGKVANWLLSKNVKPDEVVGLFMTNRPEYVVFWLGCHRVGAVAALINFNLKKGPLKHCLKISRCNICVFGTEVGDAVADVLDDLSETTFYSSGVGSDAYPRCPSMDTESAPLSCTVVQPGGEAGEAAAKRGPNDLAMLIYTSGTTGLPKAGTVIHSKMCAPGAAFGVIFGVTHEDRIYTTLPLYHTAGGMLGIGMHVVNGCTMVLRSKFSASSFMEDCASSKATVAQYIGELCRYLLATPPSASDKKHSLRMMLGNGLRPDIWQAFVDRYGLAEIGEFYGATEGNVQFFNHWKNGDDAAIGAIGRAGSIMKKFWGWKIIKFDIDSETVLRDPATGLCIECPPGEAGECVGLIKDGKYEGYYDNKEANDKKVLRDCAAKGDMWFRTGDIIMHDTKGLVYFVDRIGDTFRWKSENVATTEVSEVMGSGPVEVVEANVYGVAIPGKDGRAPMAAVVFDATESNLAALLAHMKDQLPSYSIPLFLRMLTPGEMEVTGTFKHRKVDLVKEGINPANISDRIFFLDNGKYVEFDVSAYNRVVNGSARL